MQVSAHFLKCWSEVPNRNWHRRFYNTLPKTKQRFDFMSKTLMCQISQQKYCKGLTPRFGGQLRQKKKDQRKNRNLSPLEETFLAQLQFIDWKGGRGADEQSRIRTLTCQSTARTNSETRLPSAEFNNKLKTRNAPYVVVRGLPNDIISCKGRLRLGNYVQ